METKNKELKTKNMKSGDVLVGQIYDDLKTLLDNDKDMADKVTSATNDITTQTNSKIDQLNNRINQVNNSVNNTISSRLNSISVSGSTVNISDFKNWYSDHLNATGGIGKGTYSLSTLLNELVKRSHYHSTWNSDCSYCSNCGNCDNDGL